jgi:hypothetical protein
MNTSPSNAQATSLAFDENGFFVYLADGRILNVPLAFFPRLLHADQPQREHYELSGGGTGIHWDDLDEDISVDGLLLGVGDRTRRHLEPSRQSA